MVGFPFSGRKSGLTVGLSACGGDDAVTSQGSRARREREGEADIAVVHETREEDEDEQRKRVAGHPSPKRAAAEKPARTQEEAGQQGRDLKYEEGKVIRPVLDQMEREQESGDAAS